MARIKGMSNILSSGEDVVRVAKGAEAVSIPQIEKSEVAESKSPVRAVPDVPNPAPAHYTQFQRKEARLREDQADELSGLARKLSRSKSSPGERITDNTLIRVAIDLLLSQKGSLEGESEAELRKSIGL